MARSPLGKIDDKINSFVTNRDKLKALGHEIAMLIFDHAKEHSDVSRAIKLTRAFPNSWQPQLEAWFKAFSPIRVVVKNDKCELDPKYKVAMKASTANKDEFWDRATALATPFYDLQEEAEVKSKTYDFAALVAMVQNLSKSINKKIEEGKVPEEDVASAKAIAATVASLNLQRVRAPEVKQDNAPDGANNEAPSEPATDAPIENGVTGDEPTLKVVNG